MKLRYYRELRNLSQEELGNKIGYSRFGILNLEKGFNPIYYEEALRLGSTNEDSGVLVVYFSATGTTKGVAEKIAGITGADTYEIKAAQEYTDADLNWNDPDSRSTKEQNDPSVRPEIGSEAVSLDGYTTIYIGYPIWWGEEPRIMDTFVERCDLEGKTMIPFCTSSSSGIGKSGQNLADNAGSKCSRFFGGNKVRFMYRSCKRICAESV